MVKHCLQPASVLLASAWLFDHHSTLQGCPKPRTGAEAGIPGCWSGWAVWLGLCPSVSVCHCCLFLAQEQAAQQHDAICAVSLLPTVRHSSLITSCLRGFHHSW